MDEYVILLENQMCLSMLNSTRTRVRNRSVACDH